jgi:hypothetical protein
MAILVTNTLQDSQTQHLLHLTAHLDNLSYTDWKLGATKDFGGGLALSASYVSTNANSAWWNTWTATPLGTANSSAGRGGAVVALTKTF